MTNSGHDLHRARRRHVASALTFFAETGRDLKN
jgi:hypothetical protein